VIDIDFFGEIMPEFLQRGRYFSFYLQDGTFIAQSPSSKGVPLPLLSESSEVQFTDWESEALGKLRLVQSTFKPRIESPEDLEVEPEPMHPLSLYEIEVELPAEMEVEDVNFRFLSFRRS
jgi:hypothetical protein